GGDDLVEDEQDVVLGADRREALEVALGRNQDAGRARDRLDDDSGDGRGIVQRHETLKIVGKLGAILGLAAAEGVTGQVVGMAKMVDAGEKSAEPLAVVGDAADRGATEVDAVIAALAADQADFRSIALCPVIGERDLERSLDRLGPRVGEEHVVEARRGDVDELRGAFEGLLIGVERRRAHATRVPASVRLASKMFMPPRTRASLAVSGTRKRMTLP